MTDTLMPDADNAALIDYSLRQNSGWYTICSRIYNRTDPADPADPRCETPYGVRDVYILPRKKTRMLPVRYGKQTAFFPDLLSGQEKCDKIIIWYPSPEQYCDFGRIIPDGYK